MQPIKAAPKDGTRILAWWPPVHGDELTGAWATTWMATTRGGIQRWETPWEEAMEHYGPTHWLPHPEAPK